MDEIKRAYLKKGPYQIHLKNYPLSGSEKHPHRFSTTRFRLFPSLLEYSKEKDAAYCLTCYLFSKKPSGCPGSDVFTVKNLEIGRKLMMEKVRISYSYWRGSLFTT